MRKKYIIAIVVILALLIVAGFAFGAFHWRVQKSPSSQTVSPAPSVEQFVGESAREVQSASPSATPSKEVKVAHLDCKEKNFDCYDVYYRDLVKQKGTSAAFADLKERYNNDTYVQSYCHPLAHSIGQESEAKFSSVSQAYTQGDSFCWSGYYHGVLESYMAKVGRQNIVSKINDICADIPGKERYTFDYYNCVHGLGHGVMAITQTELFESLELCDNLTGDWERQSCHSGVFMENIIIDNKNHFTNYLRKDEPMYPCTAVGEKYKQTCYLMQTSYALKVSGQNFSKVFDECSNVDAGYRNTCYQSLGRDASGNSTSNSETTKATCMLGKDFDQQSNCVIGAVKDFISYFHSDTQAKSFCNSLQEDLKNVCLTTGESYYKVF